LVVSYIQSLYWEFGSGCVLPKTGVLMQNRGASFSLDPKALNALVPGRLPFHTLNPAVAVLADGRVIGYGTMGGDGQPQTQAAVLPPCLRSALDRIAAPRWLLGRTWARPSPIWLSPPPSTSPIGYPAPTMWKFSPSHIRTRGHAGGGVANLTAPVKAHTIRAPTAGWRASGRVNCYNVNPASVPVSYSPPFFNLPQSMI
jgi:hypothetical protein